MNSTIVFVLALIGATALFVRAVPEVRRRSPSATLRPNNEVVGSYLAIVTAIYGIITGFVITSLWERQSSAEDNVVHEASSLRALSDLAEALPEAPRTALRREVIAYADAAVAREWPRMAAQDRNLSHDHPEKDRIWATVLAYEPHGDREAAVYMALIDKFDDLSDARRARCNDSLRTLPVHLWLVLTVGAVVSLLVTLFLGVEGQRSHTVLMGLSVGFTSLSLFVVWNLQNPFRGMGAITPEAFEMVLDRIRSMR